MARHFFFAGARFECGPLGDGPVLAERASPGAFAVFSADGPCTDGILFLIAHTMADATGAVERISPVVLRNLGLAWASLHSTTVNAVLPEAILRLRTPTDWFTLPNRKTGRGLCRSVNHPAHLPAACGARNDRDVRFSMRCAHCGPVDYQQLLATWPTLTSLAARLDPAFYAAVAAAVRPPWRATLTGLLTAPPGHWVQLATLADVPVRKLARAVPDPALVLALRRSSHKAALEPAMADLARNGYVKVPALAKNKNFRPGRLWRQGALILLPEAAALAQLVVARRPTFVLCAPDHRDEGGKARCAVGQKTFGAVAAAIKAGATVLVGSRVGARAPAFELAAGAGKAAGARFEAIGPEHFSFSSDPALQRELAAEAREPWAGLPDLVELVAERPSGVQPPRKRPRAGGDAREPGDGGLHGGAYAPWSVDGGGRAAVREGPPQEGPEPAGGPAEQPEQGEARAPRQGAHRRPRGKKRARGKPRGAGKSALRAGGVKATRPRASPSL
jgi:hypothetical protein